MRRVRHPCIAACVGLLAWAVLVCPSALGAAAPRGAPATPPPAAPAAPTAPATQPATPATPETPGRAPRLPITLPLGPSALPPRAPLPPVTAEDLAVGRRAWEEARDRGDAEALGEAERALYILATRADAAALADVRDALARRYDQDAAAGADAFRLGAASYALVLVSLQDCLLKSRVDRPARLDEESARAFLGRVAASREARDSVVRWGFRTFEHAAAAPQDPAERAFLLNRAIALLLTVPDYAADAAGLDARLKEFGGLKAPLAALCPETDPRKGRYEIGLDDFEKTLARLADQAADGQAVWALVGRYRDAYNRKDAAAFRAVFLPDARAVQVLAAKPMEDAIGFTEWELQTEDPYTVWVAGDTASIEVLTRYRDRDGRLHGFQVGGLRARRTPDGWRLE